MIEFLIQRTDGLWFDLPPDAGCEVYHPRGFTAHRITGRDVCWFEIAGCEVSFSYEDPGIQVSFVKGQIDREQALRIAEGVLASVEAATGQRGEVVQCS